MRSQLFRKAAAVAGWCLLAGVLTANSPSFGDEPTWSAAPKSCQSTDCAVPAIPMLARIPYLNRLFKNQPLAEAADGCVCVDEITERIGIDFDFSGVPFPVQAGDTFAFEFTCPTTSRSGVKVAEFAGPITESCRPSIVVFAPRDSMQIGTRAKCVTPECGTCPGECEASVAVCESTCHSNALPIEYDFEIVDTHLEMITQLAEAKIEHLEEKHQLQLEIARLQAKLEFQSEREKLQSEITDLRHENTALQLQLVFSQKANEVQHELAAARAEIVRLTQRSSELEAQLSTARPTNATQEPASLAKQPTILERR